MGRCNHYASLGPGGREDAQNPRAISFAHQLHVRALGPSISTQVHGARGRQDFPAAGSICDILGATGWVLLAGCWVLGAWCWVLGVGCWATAVATLLPDEV